MEFFFVLLFSLSISSSIFFCCHYIHKNDDVRLQGCVSKLNKLPPKYDAFIYIEQKVTKIFFQLIQSLRRSMHVFMISSMMMMVDGWVVVVVVFKMENSFFFFFAFSCLFDLIGVRRQISLPIFSVVSYYLHLQIAFFCFQ